MIYPLRLASAALWVFFVALRWIKLQVDPLIDWFTESILGGWEEGTKSFVRETFTNATRVVNGFFAWCLAFADREQYRSFRARWGRSQAWQDWWHEGRPSTLNAFIATHAPEAPAARKQRLNLHPPAPVKQPARPWWQRQWTSARRWLRSVLAPSRPGSARRDPLVRSGSDLFDRPSGYAVETAKRGLVEDVRIWLELGVSRFFDGVRAAIRAAFFLPPRPGPAPPPKLQRHHTAPSPAEGETWEEVMTRPRAERRRRRRSLGSWEGSRAQNTAADAIQAAGYPVEVHHVTTPDGYVIQMERIPREGARDVVFFMHGILDTSMGWVANGTGSHAFAAHDQGMDVWLGNSRSNPPRKHTEPDKDGTLRYWLYSVNELGMEDCLAQVDHIHVTKCKELCVPAGPPPAGVDRKPAVVTELAPPHATPKGLRRTASESALGTQPWRAPGLEGGPAPAPPSRLSQERAARPGGAGGGGGGRQHGHNLRSTRSARPRRQSAEAAELATDGRSTSVTANGLQPAGFGAELEQGAGDGSPPASTMNTIWSGGGSGSGSSSGEDGSRPASPCQASGGGSTPPGSPGASLSPEQAEISPDRAAFEGVERPPEDEPPARSGGDAAAAGGRDPYRLRAVGHSLGGAALLIYVVMSRKRARPHHIYRLILLTPAGFQRPAPKVALPFIWSLPLVLRLLAWVRPGKGSSVLIPTPWLRYLTFKLTADLQSVPALQELTRAGVRLLMNGDASQWDRAMQMPHYNAGSMPAISLHTGMHLTQWVRSGRFRLYDYGSAAANRREYGGEPEPPDVAAHYGLLDCPVDIMAGRADGVIAPQNVLQHYEYMRAAGAAVTYKEFDFGHLDFTFALKEELVYYVRSRLRQRHDAEGRGLAGF